MTAGLRRQRGFTLLGLLIATGLGAIVLLTAGESLLTARQMERIDRSTARNLDGARLALTLIAGSLRQAGYPGCHPDRRRNLVSTGEDPAVPAISTSNGLTIRTLRSLGQRGIVGAPVTGESLSLDRAHGVEPGQPVVVVNASGSGCVLFRQATTAIDTLDRGPGAAAINRVPAEGYRPMGERVEILVPERTTFFVDTAVGSEDGSSLFRRRESTGGDREELVVGVQSLTVEAGIDDNGDGYADRTVTGAAGLDGLDIVFVGVALQMAGANQRVATTIALRNARP
ncbi:prepilin-type N-terminal cleavage/methylation domain-containing protein [Spiribacter vilamensis]|uniref:Type IV pilus assembly protein PilW n=1 Tax=Spiribacter vilamensis TaxID=531306 RepID=A0A4Q8CYG7_9GAMM|nr:prepilin-type N-terminal cleavage/methylation domain-containing protein [Spiribacter vilamensis]RZU98036.1 type IV pilus assembly protein PilW [Spiribacter vilamensis]TVO61059.1 hypothetical protein FPL09_02570 [Spiribacter vilamensis]